MLIKSQASESSTRIHNDQRRCMDGDLHIWWIISNFYTLTFEPRLTPFLYMIHEYTFQTANGVNNIIHHLLIFWPWPYYLITSPALPWYSQATHSLYIHMNADLPADYTPVDLFIILFTFSPPLPTIFLSTSPLLVLCSSFLVLFIYLCGVILFFSRYNLSTNGFLYEVDFFNVFLLFIFFSFFSCCHGCPLPPVFFLCLSYCPFIADTATLCILFPSGGKSMFDYDI